MQGKNWPFLALALKMEEVTTSQTMQAACRYWERQRNRFTLKRLQKRNIGLLTPWFKPSEIPIRLLTSRNIRKLICIVLNRYVCLICYSSNRKPIYLINSSFCRGRNWDPKTQENQPSTPDLLVSKAVFPIQCVPN